MPVTFAASTIVEPCSTAAPILHYEDDKSVDSNASSPVSSPTLYLGQHRHRGTHFGSAIDFRAAQEFSVEMTQLESETERMHEALQEQRRKTIKVGSLASFETREISSNHNKDDNGSDYQSVADMNNILSEMLCKKQQQLDLMHRREAIVKERHLAQLMRKDEEMRALEHYVSQLLRCNMGLQSDGGGSPTSSGRTTSTIATESPHCLNSKAFRLYLVFQGVQQQVRHLRGITQALLKTVRAQQNMLSSFCVSRLQELIKRLQQEDSQRCAQQEAVVATLHSVTQHIAPLLQTAIDVAVASGCNEDVYCTLQDALLQTWGEESERTKGEGIKAALATLRAAARHLSDEATPNVSIHEMGSQTDLDAGDVCVEDEGLSSSLRPYRQRLSRYSVHRTSSAHISSPLMVQERKMSTRRPTTTNGMSQRNSTTTPRNHMDGEDVSLVNIVKNCNGSNSNFVTSCDTTTRDTPVHQFGGSVMVVEDCLLDKGSSPLSSGGSDLLSCAMENSRKTNPCPLTPTSTLATHLHEAVLPRSSTTPEPRLRPTTAVVANGRASSEYATAMRGRAPLEPRSWVLPLDKKKDKSSDDVGLRPLLVAKSLSKQKRIG